MLPTCTLHRISLAITDIRKDIPKTEVPLCMAMFQSAGLHLMAVATLALLRPGASDRFPVGLLAA